METADPLKKYPVQFEELGFSLLEETHKIVVLKSRSVGKSTDIYGSSINQLQRRRRLARALALNSEESEFFVRGVDISHQFDDLIRSGSSGCRFAFGAGGITEPKVGNNFLSHLDLEQQSGKQNRSWKSAYVGLLPSEESLSRRAAELMATSAYYLHNPAWDMPIMLGALKIDQPAPFTFSSKNLDEIVVMFGATMGKTTTIGKFIGRL